MVVRRGPTLRAQWLGQQLRELREAASLKLVDAGDYIQRDQSTISRMESGSMPPRIPDMQALLNFYGVADEPLRQSLEQQARDVWRKGWWDGYSNDITGGFIDHAWLEDRALAIRSFDALVLPGLLQTREYAEATIAAADRTASAEQIQRWVDFRMARQSVLRKDAAPQLNAILDEAVLHRVVGGTAVMRAQLHHLIAMTERANIDIGVLPLRGGAHASPDGEFEIFDMAEPFPEVAYATTPGGAVYVESEDVQRFVTAYDGLRDATLESGASSALIGKVADNLA